MSTLRIEWVWRLDGPLHIGSGLSRIGHADRLIRRDRDRRPHLPGDAVKGAIRMSAERLLRWLDSETGLEPEDKSLPSHPITRRIFNPSDEGAYYRFLPGELPANAAPFTISSTALSAESRVARTETLRTIEASSRLDQWLIKIEAEGGNWEDQESQDWKDCLFLLAAIVSADNIGGKRGSGFGRVALQDAPLSIGGPSVDRLRDESTILKISEHARTERQTGSNI